MTFSFRRKVFVIIITVVFFSRNRKEEVVQKSIEFSSFSAWEAERRAEEFAARYEREGFDEVKPHRIEAAFVEKVSERGMMN